MAVSPTPFWRFRFVLSGGLGFTPPSQNGNHKSERLGLRFLFCHSVSGISLNLGGGLGQGFVDQTTYLNTFFYSLIQDEINHRREPGLEAVGQLGLNKP